MWPLRTFAGTRVPISSHSCRQGPAHIVTLSSFYPGGFGANSEQTKWLDADLASVDRAKYPWLIVALHA